MFGQVSAVIATSLFVASFGFLWLQYALHQEARIHVQMGVFTPAECHSAITLAEAANRWTKMRHDHYPTEDVPLRDLPELNNVSKAVDERVLPLLRERFGVPPEFSMLVEDLFLIRYSPAGQSGLRTHIDDSTLSFSVALSLPEAYEGGGVHFDLLEAPIKVPQGAVVMHPSKLYHKGADVLSGTRYVLVGFVKAGDDAFISLGNDHPRSPARLHGLWARCIVPPKPMLRDSRSEAEGPPGTPPTQTAAEAAPELCFSMPWMLFHLTSQRVGVIWEGLRAVLSGEEPPSDAQEILLLNAGLLAFSIIFLLFVK